MRPTVVTQRTDPGGARPRVGAGADRHRITARLPRIRRSRTTRVYAQRWRVEVTVGAAALVVAVTVLTAWPAPSPPRHAPAGVSLGRSGLVMADSFDQPASSGQLMDHYVFDGSAAPGIGWVRADGRGLQVGVRPHTGWAGWFAVTLDAAGPGVLWHTQMTRPPQRVGDGEGEAVFAVQTASTQRSGAINYVVVSALSVHGKGEWLVGYAHGVIADADTEVLWRSPLAADTPTTEPVTVRTDGRQSLVVWLGTRKVYSSSRLHLDVPTPFQAYLEVQSENIASVALFRDFWVTDAEPVTVTGAPAGSAVALWTKAGVATATTAANGTASLEPPGPDLVGTGTLSVVGRAINRRIPDLAYAGGDLWHLAGAELQD